MDLLTEVERREVKDNGALYISGIFSVAEEKNQNGRIYPYSTLKRETDAYQKLIKERRGLGECDHPEEDVVALQNASHLVTRLWWEGKTLYGTAKVLTTPAGQVLRALINDGVQLGISSRSLGSLQEDASSGANIVQDDLVLVCFDCVSDASCPTALMTPHVISESRIREVFSKADRINRLLHKITAGE